MSTRTISLEGAEAQLSAGKITIKSGKNEVTRTFPTQYLEIKQEGGSVLISNRRENAEGKALLGTYEAHVKNMVLGVKNPFTYKLKLCSSHFPMSLKITGEDAVLTNFLGEKKPRKAKVPKGVEVKVEGEFVTIKSSSIELAGMTVTRIEQLTRLSNKDRRVFQDGIYMIERLGEPIR